LAGEASGCGWIVASASLSGSAGVASLHLARAITRRAERSAVALAADDDVSPAALAYLNRLSDHLFVAARWLAAAEGGDVLWQPGATRNS
jgi:cob(I)alamin adenosyltransferase